MDNCSCLNLDVEYGPSFSRGGKRRAYKTHLCGECGRDILPREKYEYVTGKWDNDFEVHKTCADCLSIRDAFFCSGWYFGNILNDLREHIRDLQGEISGECMSELTQRARDGVCTIIQDLWNDLDDSANIQPAGVEQGSVEVI